MSLVDRRIAELSQAAEQEAKERLWYLRCDRVRERQKRQNYDLVKSTVLRDVEKIRLRLPSRQTDFSENPAWFFDVRNPSVCGATVTVSMAQDGAELYIDVQRHSNPESVARTLVRVSVRGDDTCFEYDRRTLTPQQVSDIILAPVLG